MNKSKFIPSAYSCMRILALLLELLWKRCEKQRVIICRRKLKRNFKWWLCSRSQLMVSLFLPWPGPCKKRGLCFSWGWWTAAGRSGLRGVKLPTGKFSSETLVPTTEPCICSIWIPDWQILSTCCYSGAFCGKLLKDEVRTAFQCLHP